ncbi:MAG: ABC transporter substrate-binding protein [Chloroflexi bacterium]|nr:ABC transporter substrate-binding protein [Chloroflexota bacterium]MCY3588010.1 ABC transporter substrate-binding protein [Chloroflexota bacterium]MCY3685700.1 ABC transporter substrate-binding protein [Chloroflexota bacterium]MDE2708602.1 ABC transporter substrate-binding protein [Chloroflexota bacterium]
MPRITHGLGRAGLWIGLVLAIAQLVAGCAEDGSQQAQSVARQSVQQQVNEPSAQPQPADQPEQQQEGASVSSPDQRQQQAQPSSRQTQSQQRDTQSQTDQADAADEPGDNEDEGDSSQPAHAAQQNSQQQQSVQGDEAETVPDGTRLISLFGDVTEIVYALGAQEFLVARDASSIYPAEAEQLPNLGFAGSLNVEAILNLEPTLIIGTAMAGPPEVLEQLRQAGVEVLILEELKGLDAPQIKFRVIGDALGLSNKAEAMALDVEQRLEAVLAAAATDSPLRVLHIYIRRGGLQLVSGAGNEAQTIIEAAGGIDAAAEAGIVGWQQLTPEALVAADPDVYLVMDRGLAVVGGVEGLLEIPGMAETRAGRGQHVISMADLYLLGFGPRLPEAIADLAQFLGEIQDQVLESE